MQSMRKGILLTAIVLMIASSANASVIGPGSVEFTADGAFQHQSLSDDLGSQTLLRMSGGFLYAFSGLVQAGAGLLMQFESIDPGFGDSVSRSAFGADGTLRFNFGDSSSVVPYAEARVGFLLYGGDYYNDPSTTIQPGGGLGFRIMVNDAAAMSVGLNYIYEINAFGSDQIDAHTILLGFGLSVFPQGLSTR
jgi:hypothetical protein